MDYSEMTKICTLNSWLRKRYDNPVMIITENGWSDDGQLQDSGRIEYYRVSEGLILCNEYSVVLCSSQFRRRIC